MQEHVSINKKIMKCIQITPGMNNGKILNGKTYMLNNIFEVKVICIFCCKRVKSVWNFLGDRIHLNYTLAFATPFIIRICVTCRQKKKKRLFGLFNLTKVSLTTMIW